MSEQVNVEAVDRKVALWQTTLRAIRDAGLHFGAKFQMDWLEHHLNFPRNTLGFGAGIASINEEILPEGYYLSSRNQSGQCYVVVTPENAEYVADAFGRDAVRKLRRQVQLIGGLLKNPTANLADDQRKRLESKQEKAAIRLLLLRRSTSIHQSIREHSPKLLE